MAFHIYSGNEHARHLQESGITISDTKNTGINRVFIVVVIIDGVFIEMRADQCIVTEHFIVYRMFGFRINVVSVGGSFVSFLVDTLIHLTFYTAPFGWTEILNTYDDRRSTCKGKTHFEGIDIGNRMLYIGQFFFGTIRLKARDLIQDFFIYTKRDSSIESSLEESFTRHRNNFKIRPKVSIAFAFSLQSLRGT